MNHMNSDDLISIIIPSYNSEKYIKRAIDSLLNQSYQNVEIIVIDDKSTDATFELVKNIAKNDSRVKPVRNDSDGVSSARNRGLLESSGKYLMFLDSDDAYEKDAVEKMVNLIRSNQVEWGICNYIDVYGNDEQKNNRFLPECNIEKKEYLKNDVKNKHCIYYGALWNKIYKSDIVRNHNIRFREDMSLGEDTYFNFEYLEYVHGIGVTEAALYRYYHDNENSLTRKKNVFYNWSCFLMMYDKYIEMFRECKLLEEYKSEIAYIILSNMAIPVDELNKTDISNEEYETKLSEILDNEVVEFAIYNAKKISLTEKIIKLFFKRRNYHFMRVLLQIKNRRNQ